MSSKNPPRPPKELAMAVYSFSPLSDLVVEATLNTNPALFLVSSEILRVVSPVWRKALDPDSKFAPLEKTTVNGVEYRQTEVEGISAGSLKILLGILHHQVTSTPRSISFQSLREIAILADQYDFASALSPWPQFWIEHLTSNDTAHLRAGQEDWLFVANVFTEVPVCAKIITDISKQLILELGISKSSGANREVKIQYTRVKQVHIFGTLIEEQSENISLGLVPEKILEFIKKQRSRYLSKAIQPLWNFTQKMTNFSFGGAGSKTPVYCGNEICFSLAFGSFLRSISSTRLGSALRAARLEIPEYISLREAINTVERLKMTTLVLERPNTSNCTPSGYPLGSGAHTAERSPTRSVLSGYENTATHKQGASVNPAQIEKLARNLKGELFLMNQYDSTTKHATGLYETCPLARHLAEQQRAAVAILESVVGYTESTE
ncbi:hypothetical protein TWF481_011416 [Arthrobotrys musiformis]|uniref:F-box domain-containing protein n=1 Tax=Arthrobotrys musiformis TaxID=47236 RepID=A0AAV9VYC7_9PEZI